MTAIAQPLEAISRELMEILLDQIKNAGPRKSELKQRVLPAALIIRESTSGRK